MKVLYSDVACLQYRWKNKLIKKLLRFVENPFCPPYVYLYANLCVCLALSSLIPSLSPSLLPSLLPPSLSTYLPAAALGLLAPTDLPQTKGKDRTTEKKTQQPSDRSGLLCSGPHTVPSVTLLQTHSLSVLPLRESSLSLVSVSSNGHFDCRVYSTVHSPAQGQAPCQLGPSPSVSGLLRARSCIITEA